MSVAPWQSFGKRNLGRGCFSKTAFLANYLAVSTWILNGSSIKCHEKKHEPFSLSCVRFGSRAIQIYRVKMCLALEESKIIEPSIHFPS